MKVYTKKGDKGLTGLIGGTRIPKHHIRIETYGTIDELNSYFGLLRDQEIKEEDRSFILFIQDRLFTLGSLLAADPDNNKMTLPELAADDVVLIEDKIDLMESSLEPMKSFVLPGGHQTVSFIHISRCVCRRAERLVSALNEESSVTYDIGLQFLNRLSDYLFVFSRYMTKELKAPEMPWVPKMK